MSISQSVPPESEWADYAAVQASCGNLSGHELTRNSSGNTRPQSSELAEPLWTDPGLKSEISVRELISAKKKKKKAQAGNDLSNILPKSSHARKKPPPLSQLIFDEVGLYNVQYHVLLLSYRSSGFAKDLVQNAPAPPPPPSG